jgi:hypothetical protein
MSDAILWTLKELVAYAVYPQLPCGIAGNNTTQFISCPRQIQTKNIPNASLQHYHYTALFTKMCIFGYLAI